MVRFAHLADVHLGGWKQPEMRDLNFQAFENTVQILLKEKPDFVLIAGDLFDTAYPPIEVLKETFAQFRLLKEARIPCFLVAGSHDYSVSGKTFLDVLEKAGFAKNVTKLEIIKNQETDEIKEIQLSPVIHEGIAIYGYPGKKAGLEVQELRKIKLNDAPGMFKIFMLHTTLDKVKGTLPIDSVSAVELPKADYYAMGHIHVDFQYENFVYPGPLFPNNFQELEDLQQGSFYIVDTQPNQGENSLKKYSLRLKEPLLVSVEITNALIGTDKILQELEKHELKDKIILLRIKGQIEKGKTSDIKFQKIEEHAKAKGAYFILRNTHELKIKEQEIDSLIEESDSENIEEQTIKTYSEQSPSDFNKLIPELINALAIEKQEGEKNEIFNARLLESTRRILKF